MAGTSFWTDEKTAELKRLWLDEQMSGTQIAERLGLKDRNAVMGKLHRLGLQRGKPAESGQDPKPAAAEAGKAPSPVLAAAPETAPEMPVAATAAPPAAPEPAEPPAVQEEERYAHPVMRLTERTCRWPIGDPQKPSFRFCCKDKLGGHPYCLEHVEVAYQVPDRNPRRRDQGVRKAA